MSARVRVLIAAPLLLALSSRCLTVSLLGVKLLLDRQLLINLWLLASYQGLGLFLLIRLVVIRRSQVDQHILRGCRLLLLSPHH